MGENNSAVEQRFVRMRELYPNIHIRGSEAARDSNPCVRVEDHSVKAPKAKRARKPAVRRRKIEIEKSDSDEEDNKNDNKDVEDVKDDLMDKKRRHEDRDDDSDSDNVGGEHATLVSETVSTA